MHMVVTCHKDLCYIYVPCFLRLIERKHNLRLDTNNFVHLSMVCLGVICASQAQAATRLQMQPIIGLECDNAVKFPKTVYFVHFHA
jgi:hypothetical protein